MSFSTRELFLNYSDERSLSFLGEDRERVTLIVSEAHRFCDPIVSEANPNDRRRTVTARRDAV